MPNHGCPYDVWCSNWQLSHLTRGELAKIFCKRVTMIKIVLFLKWKKNNRLEITQILLYPYFTIIFFFNYRFFTIFFFLFLIQTENTLIWHSNQVDTSLATLCFQVSNLEWVQPDYGRISNLSNKKKGGGEKIFL